LSRKISPRDDIEQAYASTTLKRPFVRPIEKAIHPRGPVRHIVRPFIKEFKTRLAKSSAAHPQLISDPTMMAEAIVHGLDVFSTRPKQF